MIIFNFQIDPVAKGRPRIWNGRAVTPPKTRAFENAVKVFAKNQYRGEPLKGALSVVVVFLIRKPKTVKREYPTTKNTGDLDNHAKALLDSLNGIAFEDDSQIIELNISKKYGQVGGIFVDIRPYLQH